MAIGSGHSDGDGSLPKTFVVLGKPDIVVTQGIFYLRSVEVEEVNEKE